MSRVDPGRGDENSSRLREERRGDGSRRPPPPPPGEALPAARDVGPAQVERQPGEARPADQMRGPDEPQQPGVPGLAERARRAALEPRGPTDEVPSEARVETPAGRARMSDQSFGMMLLSPAFAFVLCLAIYPIVRVLWLSFYRQNLGTGLQPEFVGIGNYIRVLNDGHFFQTVQTTVLFTVMAVGIELLLGLAFALLANRSFAGRGVARASLLVPWALPTAVLALAWVWIFNDQFGVFNDLLMKVGIISEPIAWLGSGGTALFALIFADVWKTTPFMMIILLAGLQNIPSDLYEAAAIDGARPWRQFRMITLPLLVPSIMLAVLFRTIQSFGIFDLIYVMTGGGPGGATETVAIYNYNTYLRYLDFGYGSAMIVVTFLIMAVLAAAIYLPLSRTRGARSA